MYSLLGQLFTRERKTIKKLLFYVKIGAFVYSTKKIKKKNRGFLLPLLFLLPFLYSTKQVPMSTQVPTEHDLSAFYWPKMRDNFQ